MKNKFLYCKNLLRNNSLRIFILTLLFSVKVNSQVSCYAFGESSASYTALSSSTNMFSNGWNDNVSVAIPIGFTFNFNEADYTSCFVNSNGYITFGAASGSGNYNPISSGSYSGAISALGRDLISNNSTVVRGVEGSAPNRVFVVQWNNARRNNATGTWNFQIRLNETTNKIDIVYGTCSASNSLGYSAQIGLRGSSNTDFNNRTLPSPLPWFNNTVKGPLADASVISSSTSLPVSGTTFSWTPNNKTVIPSIIADKDSFCVNENIVELQASGNSIGASTLWFKGGCGNVSYIEEWHSAPSGTNQTIVNSFNDGILDVTTANIAPPAADAQIDMPNLFSLPINTSAYKYVVIRYKIVSGIGGQSEIYFYKGNLALAEDKVVRGNLISDNNWHILNIDMTASGNWNNDGGNIKGWRFDYSTGKSVNMLIDYITLTDRAVLENTNDDDSKISVAPTGTTNYFALRSAESPCFNITACTSKTIYRGKTWNGGPTGDWSVASNWIPVGVPASDDCIEVGSSLTMAITGSHAVGKTLNVTGGNFTINSGSSITLKEALTVASGATFTLEDSASLVQEGATNTNSGAIIVKRTAKPMKRYDFSYWSSPVASQTLYNLSPETLGDKYYSWNPIAQSWLIHYNGSNTMLDGKGYIVRAPQSFPIDVVSSTNFSAVFNGKPNSGDITIDVKGNTSTVPANYKWNLIGNPYPSALNLDKFLGDSFNASKINGTIYLWTHNSAPSNAIAGDANYNYTASDYAAYNGVGGTATVAATVNPLNPVVNLSPNANVPTGYLASGQSFFVKGKADATVKFTNDMRERAGNTQFFRQSNVAANNSEKNRIWLNIRNSQGAFNQTLIGYVPGATNDFEDNFDGELFGGNYVTIYSINSDKKLTIQGRALPFENTDIVPLGITTTIAGNFSVSLDNFDGMFSVQDIFLKDKTLDIIHDLKSGGYEFASEIGTFDNRFEIVYQNVALGIGNPNFNANSIVIYKNDKTIVVNSGISTISNVQVFDIQGRLLLNEKNVNTSETILKNLPSSNQVLIVKVQTLEGNIVSKKIIY